VLAVVAAALVAYAAVDDARFGLGTPQLEERAGKVELPAVGTAEPTPDVRSRTDTGAGVGVEVALVPPAGGSASSPVVDAPSAAPRGGSAPVREGGTVAPSPTTQPAPAAPTPVPATTPPDTPPPPAEPPAATPQPTPSPSPPRRTTPTQRALVPEQEDDEESDPIEEIIRDLLPPEPEPSPSPEAEKPAVPDLPVLPEPSAEPDGTSPPTLPDELRELLPEPARDVPGAPGPE
jgi:hypothetical protein